ncbi:SPOSA6832_00422, partial [Sporobolomyces salmonicolor]
MDSSISPSVKFLAQIEKSPLPRSSNTAFEFLFSQPFVKGSQTWKDSPKELQKHHVAPIPPQKPIFRDGKTGAILSYGRLRSDALSIASSLTNSLLKLKPLPASASDPNVNRGAIVSPVILLHLPNCLPFCTLAYGTLASGLTLTAVNPVLTPQELAHVLALSKPAAIITSPSGVGNFQLAFQLLSPELKAELDYSSKGNVFIVDPDSDDYGASAGSLHPASRSLGGWTVNDWKVLLPKDPKPFTPPKYTGSEDALRAAVILWSSGTSGKSKGVILSHRAIGSAQIGVWHASTLGADERLVGLPPFYHIFGMANVLFPAVSFGASVTTISKFDPVSYLTIAQEIRATHLHFSPPIAVLLAKSPMVDGFDLSSVRGCTSGGAPLATSVIEQVYKRLGVLIKIGYGLSETGGATQQQCMTWDEMKPQLGSCGAAYPATEIKIRSLSMSARRARSASGSSGFAPLGPWTAGSHYCRRSSECCAISYLNNLEATRDSWTADGWFATGDIGKLDPQGNLYITDRLKELIKVKGFQVSPAELEDSLCASPLVADAAVTSVYHDDHATEYPRAFVVPVDKALLVPGQHAEEFAHALRKHIEGKHAPYKWCAILLLLVPFLSSTVRRRLIRAYWLRPWFRVRGGFVIVDAVPKSPAGKILRRLLKDSMGHHVQVYEDKKRAKL